MKPNLANYLDAQTENWRVYCTNCMNQIHDVMYTCAECEDFRLCMQCFVCGAEIGPHKRTHPCKMVDLGTFCVFGKRKKHKKKSGKSETSGDSQSRAKKCADPSCKMYISGDDSSDSDDERRRRRKNKVKPRKYHYELERGALVKVFESKGKGDRANKKDRVWRALHELELIDGIQRYGYGNWKDIAQVLAPRMPGITPEEVADHYAIYYILTDIGDYTWDWKHDSERIVDLFNRNEERKIIRKHPENDFDDLSQLELDALGFMPKRDDFEREFDNEAESLISNLTVGEEDEIEQKFKLAQIEMYQQRLVERFRKKAVVRKYGLVRKFLQVAKLNPEAVATDRAPNPNAPSTSAGSDTSSVFSPFLRFGTQESLQNLFLDLQKEYYLKLLIRKLLKYKRRGLTKLNEIKEFEEMRKSKILREKTKELLGSAKMEVDDEQDSSSEHDTDDEEEYGLSLNDANIEKIMAPISSSKLQEIFKMFVKECDKDTTTTDEAKGIKVKEEEEGEEDQRSQQSSSNATPSRKSRRRSQARSTESQSESTTDAGGNGQRVSRHSAPVQLSNAEKKLCAELKIQHSLYHALKTMIIKEISHKSLIKNRRYSLPFILDNEPSSLQCQLMSTFGVNTTYEDVDRVMNRVIKHLQTTGEIPKN